MQLLALELRALFFRLDSVIFCPNNSNKKKFFSCASDRSFFYKSSTAENVSIIDKGLHDYYCSDEALLSFTDLPTFVIKTLLYCFVRLLMLTRHVPVV